MRSLVFALLLVSASAQAQQISFTFPTDNQGWVRGNFGANYSASFAMGSAATWTNGTITGTDHSGYAFHWSPSVGGNHADLFGGKISLDFQSSFSGNQDPFIVLGSSTQMLVLEHSVTASAGLIHYEFSLDSSSGWYFNSSEYYQGTSAVVASNAQIQSVLSDLRFIGVSTDINSGNDSTITDNVMLTPAVGSLTFSPSPVYSGNLLDMTVTLTAPAPLGGLVVNLSSSDAVNLPVPASVVVPAGLSSVVVPLASAAVEQDSGVTVIATSSRGEFQKSVVLLFLAGDIDKDGDVDLTDYLLLAAAFDSTNADSNWNPAADIDKNGTVDLTDYLLLAANFDLPG